MIITSVACSFVTLLDWSPPPMIGQSVWCLLDVNRFELLGLQKLNKANFHWYFSMRSSGKYNKKSSLWPPFRLPGEINSNYVGLRRLLHSRTMHGVIFTLLYKVSINSCIMARLKILFAMICIKKCTCQKNITT